MNQNGVEFETYYDTSATVETYATAVEVPSTTFRSRTAVVLLSAVWAVSAGLTLMFGGVHPTTYLVFQSLVLLGGGVLLLRSPTACTAALTPAFPLSRLLVRCLAIFAVFIAAHYGVHSLSIVEHPVLGSASPFANFGHSLTALREVLFLLALFVVTRAALLHQGRVQRRFVIALGAIGLGVATIGTAQWVSDNGLLLWTFAPDNTTPSTRVRWPFVNPNHLAHFLLPTLFLTIAVFRNDWHDTVQLFDKNTRFSQHRATISSQQFQRLLRRMVFTLVVLLVVGLAIAGSLSRSAWIAVAVGLLATAVAEQILFRSGTSTRTKNYRSREREIRERRRRRIQVIGVSILIVCLAVIFRFFLQSRGAELVSDRVELGLMHAKDDLRWQLYSDTIPLIAAHPLFGIGAGNWENTIRQSINPLLSGVNPVYLHSDPLQLVAEFGLLGALPFALLILGIWMKAAPMIKGCQTALAARSTLAILIGCSAVVFASFYDFPFRIPAIPVSLVLFLAACFALLEEDAFPERHRRHRSRAKD